MVPPRSGNPTSTQSLKRSSPSTKNSRVLLSRKTKATKSSSASSDKSTSQQPSSPRKTRSSPREVEGVPATRHYPTFIFPTSFKTVAQRRKFENWYHNSSKMLRCPQSPDSPGAKSSPTTGLSQPPTEKE